MVGQPLADRGDDLALPGASGAPTSTPLDQSRHDPLLVRRGRPTHRDGSVRAPPRIPPGGAPSTASRAVAARRPGGGTGRPLPLRIPRCRPRSRPAIERSGRRRRSRWSSEAGDPPGPGRPPSTRSTTRTRSANGMTILRSPKVVRRSPSARAIAGRRLTPSADSSAVRCPITAPPLVSVGRLRTDRRKAPGCETPDDASVVAPPGSGVTPLGVDLLTVLLSRVTAARSGPVACLELIRARGPRSPPPPWEAVSRARRRATVTHTSA